MGVRGHAVADGKCGELNAKGFVRERAVDKVLNGKGYGKVRGRDPTALGTGVERARGPGRDSTKWRGTGASRASS